MSAWLVKGKLAAVLFPRGNRRMAHAEVVTVRNVGPNLITVRNEIGEQFLFGRDLVMFGTSGERAPRLLPLDSPDLAFVRRV